MSDTEFLFWVVVVGAPIVASLVAWAKWLARQGEKPTPKATPRPVKFTVHSRDRMRERDVRDEWVHAAIEAPERVTYDPQEDSYRLDHTVANRTTKVWVTQWPVPKGEAVVVKSTAVKYRLEMNVPTDRIGRLIGKGGANIKRIEGWYANLYNPQHTHVEVDRTTGAVSIWADSPVLLERARVEVQKSVGA